MVSAAARPFIWVAITATLVLAAVVVLQLADGGPERPLPDRAAAPTAQPEPRADDAAPTRSAPTGAPPRFDAAVAAGPRPPANRGVDAYRAQSEEDQRRLGEAYLDLERLWQQGRFGGSGPAAKKALQELVEKYGESNRAACARYLLGKQAFASPPNQRIQQVADAAKQLEQVVEASPDARCDNGARAANLSKLLLATYIYRNSDYERSLRTLRDLAAADPDETDNLGVPLALRARTILTEAGQADPSWPKPPLDAAGVQLR